MRQQPYARYTNNTSTTHPPTRRQPSLFTLIVLAFLLLGLLIVGIGVLCLLFAPLIIGAGVALALCAAFVLSMILLSWAARWIMAQLIHHARHTLLYQVLSPWISALLRHLAQQLVALLIAWLEQGTDSGTAGERRRRSRYRLQLAHQ